MSQRHDVVICGGGTGGLTVAAQLRQASNPPSVAIVEPSETHYYQPLWTLVGGGVYDREASARDERDFIPPGCDWVKDRVASFDPDAKAVVLASGERLEYGHLVVAMGLQVNWDGIPGLAESVGAPGTGVCSNYSYETVDSTWENVREFRGGRAIFTEPITGVKCGGAPQKIMYLAEDHWRRTGVRDACEILFCNGKGSIFSSPHYAPALERICDERGIDVRYETNLVELRPDRREAVFRHGPTGEESVLAYDMIHVTPPMGPLDVLRDSPLAAESGWVDVDQHTLRHVRYDDVFALGDCSSLPTSKTGAAIRKQAPTVVRNLLDDREGKALSASYDGYTSCPLVTGYGRLILAEFDYSKEARESFPFDQREERYSMYALKAYALPRMYWHGMLKGRM